jgi:uncharacterized protein involved in exopolysaccharide biosynthesis
MFHSTFSRRTATAVRNLTEDAKQDLVAFGEMFAFWTTYYRAIGLTALTVVIAAIWFLIVTPPIYTSKAQILIDPQSPQPLRERVDDTNYALDSAQVESQIAVLRSERIALLVANRLDLFNDQELLGSNLPKIGTTELDLPSNFESVRAVMEKFARNLDVRRAGLSYAIDIAYSSSNPDKAAKVANAMAVAYVADQLTMRAQAGRQGSDWLEERIDKLRKQMNAASFKVQEFRARRDYRLTSPEITKEAAGASGEQVTLEELESKAATYRKIYESYLQAYTDSVQRQSFPVPNARVITPATRPLSKSFPKSGLILALASVLGILGGVAIAISHKILTGRKALRSL